MTFVLTMKNTILLRVQCQAILHCILSFKDSPVRERVTNHNTLNFIGGFMKHTSFLALALLVVVCFGLLYVFSGSVKTVSAAPQQRFSRVGNHKIDLVTAMRLIKNHRRSARATTIKGGFFARNAFENILAQPGCIGIRYYYAQTDDGSPTVVLVGVDEAGTDIQTGEIMELSLFCPPYCGSATSELEQ